ncbi:MAG: cell division protein FtsL [Candidatus Aminicenantes bacterium]|nr:cell division protein FtsL [Candidatus Aminicenantes bacterium]
MKTKKKQSISGIFVLIAFFVFILLFTYSSLNLKNIDYGYKMQKLLQAQKKLKEEIDKLRAKKATLLNLERVEKVVMKELGYRYPEAEQFIKIFEIGK